MSNRPIILDFALSRRDDSNIPFIYDSAKDINVIQSAHGDFPYIDAPMSITATHTETRIARERDDAEFSCSELFTKTEVGRERDDDELCPMEFFTKTKADRESDDDAPWLFAELYSKTYVDRERDDDDTAYHQ